MVFAVVVVEPSAQPVLEHTSEIHTHRFFTGRSPAGDITLDSSARCLFASLAGLPEGDAGAGQDGNQNSGGRGGADAIAADEFAEAIPCAVGSRMDGAAL